MGSLLGLERWGESSPSLRLERVWVLYEKRLVEIGEVMVDEGEGCAGWWGCDGLQLCRWGRRLGVVGKHEGEDEREDERGMSCGGESEKN